MFGGARVTARYDISIVPLSIGASHYGASEKQGRDSMSLFSEPRRRRRDPLRLAVAQKKKSEANAFSPCLSSPSLHIAPQQQHTTKQRTSPRPFHTTLCRSSGPAATSRA